MVTEAPAGDIVLFTSPDDHQHALTFIAATENS
jgi:hypothetical protein